jgi:hypothetical protein
MNAGAAYLRPATDGRPWRNWQTRTVQVRVPKGVVVRLHSGAPPLFFFSDYQCVASWWANRAEKVGQLMFR